MKRLLLIIILLAVAGMAWAAAPGRGGVYADAGISTFERTLGSGISAGNLWVYAHSADVQLLIKPHSANQDTFVVRAGTDKHFSITHRGFKVIRPSATAVDVEWW